MYDEAMTKHRSEINPNHPETPERIAHTWHALETRGLTKRCKVIEVGVAEYWWGVYLDDLHWCAEGCGVHSTLVLLLQE